MPLVIFKNCFVSLIEQPLSLSRFSPSFTKFSFFFVFIQLKPHKHKRNVKVHLINEINT